MSRSKRLLHIAQYSIIFLRRNPEEPGREEIPCTRCRLGLCRHERFDFPYVGSQRPLCRNRDGHGELAVCSGLSRNFAFVRQPCPFSPGENGNRLQRQCEFLNSNAKGHNSLLDSQTKSSFVRQLRFSRKITGISNTDLLYGAGGTFHSPPPQPATGQSCFGIEQTSHLIGALAPPGLLTLLRPIPSVL